MAKIAYILLCHRDPASIIRQASSLTAVGDYLAIHFDASAKPEDYAALVNGLRDNPNVALAKRVKCGWGEWSLIQGTLNALEAADEAFPDATHFYMISGDCTAIKPAAYVHGFLDENEMDFIEHNDYFESDWIKVGLKEERLIYRHWFNERNHKSLFYRSMNLQKSLGLKRQIPKDLHMMIGSQWWCLRRRTVEAILQFVKSRPDIVRFFKTTWIPDETFFQTLTLHLIPRNEVESRTLTFLMFSDYGMPVSFYNDQYDFLLSQDFLFARKISPYAIALKERLADLYSGPDINIELSNEGRRLYDYVTKRGRVGRRFAPRYWEQESNIGRERELLVLVCKKWHVAKRLLRSITEIGSIHGIAYLFDEADTVLPDLGGLQSTLKKRSAHRRAVMRLLYEQMETNRIVICIDPANIDVLDDFFADRCQTKILEIACAYSDEYLTGHARRVGLAGEKSSQDTINRLLPTIRQDFSYEANLIRDRNYRNFYSISENSDEETNAMILADFLEVSEDQGREIIRTPHLFEG